MTRKDPRRLQVERTVAMLQRKWGQDAIRRGAPAAGTIPRLGTGFPELDAALGGGGSRGGGLPRGRITLLSGAPTSGKITLAALALAQAQTKLRRPAAYIDLAHTCDADYLERCGVRLDDLLVVRPQDGRQALDLTLNLADRGEVAVLLFDHWDALAETATIQRYAAALLDPLAGVLARRQTTLLVLDETTGWRQRLIQGAGRAALDAYTAVHLRLAHEQWFYDGADVRGYQARVTIQKNKLGTGGQVIPIAIHFNGVVRGKGI